jgi:hypothetical protein
MKTSRKTLKDVGKIVKVKWKQRNKELYGNERLSEKENQFTKWGGIETESNESYPNLERAKRKANHSLKKVFRYSRKLETYKIDTVIGRSSENQTEGKEQSQMCKKRLPKVKGKFLRVICLIKLK